MLRCSLLKRRPVKRGHAQESNQLVVLVTIVCLLVLLVRGVPGLRRVDVIALLPVVYKTDGDIR